MTQCPGCEVVFIPPNVAVPVPSRPTRIACRLHAAAPQLLEALNWYAEQGHWRQDGPTGLYRIVLHGDLEEEADGRMMAGKRARAAIAAVKETT